MSEYECPICSEQFDSPKARGTHRRWNHDNPWEDRELLYQEYIVENNSTKQLADEWNCGDSTISEWVRKFGFERPYDNKKVIESMYVERRMSTTEIASGLNTSASTISRRLKEFNIPSRKRTSEVNGNTISSHNLLKFNIDGEYYSVRKHRMVAYAHRLIDFDDLFSPEPHIHHKNGIGWINSVENLKPVTSSEHARIHATENVD